MPWSRRSAPPRPRSRSSTTRAKATFTDASLSDEYDPEAAALLLGARPHVLRQGRPMSAVGLHHVVAGSGPPLLLLHGFPQTHCAGTP